jgi:3-hydroxybutyryl-CoA dehydrogenase
VDSKQVGIVGFGTMGVGVAHLSAIQGHKALVLARTEARKTRGLGQIKGFLDSDVRNNRRTQEDADAILGRISFTSNYEDLGSCDIIIEAVTESIPAKREVYPTLDKVAGPNTVIASNTSSIPIVEMAAMTTKPERVVGLHFFNPAPLMKAVEVIRPITASDEAISFAAEFGESLGKTVLMCKDIPGFLINRLLWPFLLDGIRVYEQGMASRDDIDSAIRMGLNHPMGPLQLADLLGLDVLLGAAEVFYNELRDPRFAAPTMLRRMVTAGHLGRKTGKGFYDYPPR